MVNWDRLRVNGGRIDLPPLTPEGIVIPANSSRIQLCMWNTNSTDGFAFSFGRFRNIPGPATPEGETNWFMMGFTGSPNSFMWHYNEFGPIIQQAIWAFPITPVRNVANWSELSVDCPDFTSEKWGPHGKLLSYRTFFQWITPATRTRLLLPANDKRVAFGVNIQSSCQPIFHNLPNISNSVFSMKWLFGNYYSWHVSDYGPLVTGEIYWSDFNMPTTSGGVFYELVTVP